jgi:hypothetical protein
MDIIRLSDYITIQHGGRDSDRIFFGGMTGSGKTYAAQLALDQVTYWVALDNKGRFHFPGAALVTDFDKLYRASKTHNRIVYRPPAELAEGSTEFIQTMDAFYWWIYRRENCVCYTDEVTAVSNSFNILPGHNALMKRGRELNIGCWNASQQPVNCHNTLISEAEHIFCFFLNLEGHRKKIAGIMGDDVLEYNPRKDTHQFWYINQSKMEVPILHDALPYDKRFDRKGV